MNTRLWKKQEKRIVNLMYQKGILDDMRIDLEQVCWEGFKSFGRNRRVKGKRRHTNCVYCFTKYLPELHYVWVDYWGEGDSRGVVDIYLDSQYWNHWNEDTNKSSFVYKGRKWLIKHLESLPTVHYNSIKKHLYMGSI